MQASEQSSAVKEHRTFKTRMIELAILAGVLLLITIGVIASGIVPIKASSGHWPITEAILSFASRRSIETHSSFVAPPDLNEPRMIRLGAATYQSNCAWCHGSPVEREPVVPGAMTPRPPNLQDTARSWEDRELFYIAKHGIMLTGMPAWPTQSRDDDILPLVAFLKELDAISEDEYRELLPSLQPSSLARSEDGASQELQRLLVACIDCHHTDGSSAAGPRVPSLAGQSSTYLAATLNALRSGSRPSGIMQPVAARLSDDAIQLLAEHFASQPPADTDPQQLQSSNQSGDLAVKEDARRKRSTRPIACRKR